MSVHCWHPLGPALGCCRCSEKTDIDQFTDGTITLVPCDSVKLVTDLLNPREPSEYLQAVYADYHQEVAERDATLLDGLDPTEHWTEIEVAKSSGNVFADLGFPDAEERLERAKARLVVEDRVDTPAKRAADIERRYRFGRRSRGHE